MAVSGNPVPTPRAAPRRVLEDASGRRLQRMRWVGRAVALLFLIWLALVILGGLGVGPVGRLPLGNVLRASPGPPPLRHVPTPVAPAPADLVPALPAPVTPAAAAAATRRAATPGQSAVAPGQTKKTTTTTTATTPGRSGVAPGHTKTTTTVRGKSTTAPGRAKRTTTTTATTTTVATVPGKALGHGKKP